MVPQAVYRVGKKTIRHSTEESRTAFIHQMPVSTMDQFLSTTLRENILNSNYTAQVKDDNPSDMFHVKAKG